MVVLPTQEFRVEMRIFRCLLQVLTEKFTFIRAERLYQLNLQEVGPVAAQQYLAVVQRLLLPTLYKNHLTPIFPTLCPEQISSLEQGIKQSISTNQAETIVAATALQKCH